jgi:CBS-domain-containing membrane protein
MLHEIDINKSNKTNKKQKTPWPQSESELYITIEGQSLFAEVIPTFADRGCHVVSVTDPCGRILGFLDRSRYFFFQIAHQLYSRG